MIGRLLGLLGLGRTGGFVYGRWGPVLFSKNPRGSWWIRNGWRGIRYYAPGEDRRPLFSERMGLTRGERVLVWWGKDKKQRGITLMYPPEPSGWGEGGER